MNCAVRNSNGCQMDKTEMNVGGMERAKNITAHLAAIALFYLSSCSHKTEIAEFRHQNGGAIKINMTNKTMNILGAQYKLRECFHNQFVCFKAADYAIAFPKKCKPQPDIEAVTNFDYAIGYEHLMFVPNKTGYSAVHGPLNGRKGFLFLYDEPKIRKIFFSRTVDLRVLRSKQSFTSLDLDPYEYTHVAGTHELRCSE